MNNLISQIFISSKGEELPNFLKKATLSIKREFPEYGHKIYGNEELREFIKINYGDKVLWAFDSLRPYSYRSDLGRFCLLYKLGGWYFDIAIHCKSSIKLDSELDLLCFRDEQRHSKTSWAVSGGIIWSKPKNNIFSHAIDQVILNCQEKWYGKTPLCPTGPSLLGEAIANKNRGKNIQIGDLVRPMIPFTRKNMPYLKSIFKSRFILPNGKTIGIVKPANGGDLKTLGMKGSNNYNDFWHEKSVYNEIEYKQNYS